jgi:hypothetical protein
VSGDFESSQRLSRSKKGAEEVHKSGLSSAYSVSSMLKKKRGGCTYSLSFVRTGEFIHRKLSLAY